MREKEGIASDNYSDQLDKEKPKNVTDSNFDSADKVICIIKYGLSVLISLPVEKNSVSIFFFIFIKKSLADDLKGREQEFEDIIVTLSKCPGRGLGLSVVGRRDGCGVFISDMVSRRMPYRSILYRI